jgi:CubicO group peptidase (beta-lactamase class C family)
MRAMIPASDTTTPSQRLDSVTSDPVALGWMVGAPPPPDKRVCFADASFTRFPRTRWAFSHMRQLMPTAVVAREDAPIVPLGGGEPMTWAQSLGANFTDGILVMHRGRIVYERYFGVLTPYKQHIAFSVTKSFVATLAAALIHEGALDEHAPVSHYLPELAKGGYADATLRQVLDMTTGLDYVEDYAGPETFCEYIQTVQKGSPHGERFAYKTVNTDTLAWVMRRVTGQTLCDLMRERFWKKLGVEQDAYFSVDAAGFEFAGGGLNVTLRDMARFGEMMRLGGSFLGQQIVPTAAVDDIRRGGNHDHFALAGYELLPGWSYRSMWWVTHNAHGAFTARGIHGQAIYIDPAAEMVIARFASHPQGANYNLDPTSLPAYHAIGAYLRSGG